MNWKVGDRALFVSVNGNSDHPDCYGQECQLIRYIGRYNPSPTEYMTRAWQVQFSSKSHPVNELCLRPIYDGNEKTSWSECIFKPLTRVLSE